MAETLEELERKRKDIYGRLASVGDFRRGSLLVSSRRCGKKNCACAQPAHPGHKRYLWSTTTKGNRSKAKTLGLGPALAKASKEASNYREFLQLVSELVKINEKICDLRPLIEIEDEDEMEALKKKLRRQFAAKRRRR